MASALLELHATTLILSHVSVCPSTLNSPSLMINVHTSSQYRYVSKCPCDVLARISNNDIKSAYSKGHSRSHSILQRLCTALVKLHHCQFGLIIMTRLAPLHYSTPSLRAEAVSDHFAPTLSPPFNLLSLYSPPYHRVIVATSYRDASADISHRWAHPLEPWSVNTTLTILNKTHNLPGSVSPPVPNKSLTQTQQIKPYTALPTLLVRLNVVSIQSKLKYIIRG